MGQRRKRRRGSILRGTRRDGAVRKGEGKGREEEGRGRMSGRTRELEGKGGGLRWKVRRKTDDESVRIGC